MASRLISTSLTSLSPDRVDQEFSFSRRLGGDRVDLQACRRAEPSLTAVHPLALPGNQSADPRSRSMTILGHRCRRRHRRRSDHLAGTEDLQLLGVMIARRLGRLLRSNSCTSPPGRDMH